MSSNQKIRVRFAPSPTGYLHVGGARSALFNYLFAHRTNGTFILRIEDTDQNRFVENAMKEIYDSLRWLGLTWDEGPEVGGDYGPYIQSQRLDIYKKHAQMLIESGHAYRCFCTPERLTELRTHQEQNKLPLGYDKHCRNLSEHEIKEKLDSNIPYVIRLKIPGGRKIVFNDLIRGPIEYDSDILDDLVLLKSDGFPTYHMAHVVDDHLMEISHVMRGDEWIASTPRHILLYEAFGWTPPQIAHLPVILSPDGGKLSKRKGAASVMDYKKAGYLSDALFNFLALLGWAPGDDREKMSRDELIASFNLEQISPKASVLDEKKLEWMNGLYMAEASSDVLAGEVLPFWKQKGWVSEQAQCNDNHILQVIDIMKVRSKKLTELVESPVYFFVDPDQYEDKAARKYFNSETVNILNDLVSRIENCLEFTHDKIEAVYKEYSESSSVPIGKLIHPTRLAISGVSFGPGLFEMMVLLGKETVIRRMQKAVSFINNRSEVQG